MEILIFLVIIFGSLLLWGAVILYASFAQKVLYVGYTFIANLGLIDASLIPVLAPGDFNHSELN